MIIEETKIENLFKKSKVDYLFYFSRILNRVKVEPEMLQIMLTSRCNLKCRICEAWKKHFESELTTEEIKSLIDQAIKMQIKSIYFTGGEALLRKDIFELIDYASRPTVITSLNTNGSFMTEEMAEKIVLSKLRNITFSIDSHNPRIHNMIRGERVFERAMKAIKYINYYRKKFHREYTDGNEKRLDVGMVCVIMKCNMKALPKLVKLARKNSCCYVGFQPLVYNESLPKGRNVKSSFWIEKKDTFALEKVFRKLEVMKRKMSGFISIDFMAEKTIEHFREERKVNTCFLGFKRIFISPPGDISFVCFDSFGNAKQDDLKEAWNSEKASSIREKIRECRVYCTQFCSERPESENLMLIHDRLAEGIKTYPWDTQQEVFKEEYYFLKGILEELRQDERNNGADFRENIEEMEKLLVLIRDRLALRF